jgi:NifB/MoaA-like Fe-S oxidoreductase
VRLAALRSNYWGQEITVTGLLTGQDLLRGLKGKDLGDAIVLPSLMLKHGDTRFLDDMTVEELARQLGIPILPVNGIEELIDACIQTTTGDQKLRLPEQNLPAPTKSFPTITLSS